MVPSGGRVLHINGISHAVPSGGRSHTLVLLIRTRSHRHEARTQTEGTSLTLQLPTQNPVNIILYYMYDIYNNVFTVECNLIKTPVN